MPTVPVKQNAGALLLMVVSVVLCALGTAIGVWLQVLVTFSLEEDASIARYVGAAAGISVGALVARYGRTRRGKWWTTLVRMVVFVALGYPIVGAVLYALAFPTVDREHAHFVAGHFAVFGPIYWLPLLAGLALVERRRASPKGGELRLCSQGWRSWSAGAPRQRGVSCAA